MSQPSESWPVRRLQQLVSWLAVGGGLALVVMMVVTCADVVLRSIFNTPIKGTVDLVGITGALTIALSLPYTTAVKGHVAVEYFFLKLGPRGRVVVDTITRVLMIAFFMALGWQSASYGNALRASKQVAPTLEIPIFWVPYVISFCCAVIILVKIYHLTHPGKSLLKP